MVKSYKDMPDIAISLFSMAHNKTGSWRIFKPLIDDKKCIKCLLCWKYCPDGCIEIDLEKNTIAINYDYCKGCGICATECKKNAIEMVRE